MIKLIGNFATPEQYENFHNWMKKSKLNLESFQTSIPTNPFAKGGYIIFDETTPEGSNLQTGLLVRGWSIDETYTPENHTEKIRLQKESKDKADAEDKANQDKINEDKNKPNLIKVLEDPESGFFHDRDSVWLHHPERTFEEVKQYHQDMIQKNDLVNALAEPEWRGLNDDLNVIYKRRNENQKKLPEMKIMKDNLKTENIKLEADIQQIVKEIKIETVSNIKSRMITKQNNMVKHSENIDLKIRSIEDFEKSVADDTVLFDEELPKYKTIEQACVSKYSTKTLKELRVINQKLIDEAKKKIGE